MRQPPPAGPAGPAPANPTGVPVRPLAAWTLLVLVATMIIFGFLSWIFPPFQLDLAGRVSYQDFTTSAILVAPLLAVLIATKAGPLLPQARTMSLVALAEYGAALLLGGLALLFTIADKFDVGGRGAFHAFGGIIQGFGEVIVELLRLALLALAALWVYQKFLNLGGRLPQLKIRT